MSVRRVVPTIATVVLLSAGLSYLNIPLIGPAVRMISAVVLPGWLLTTVLFVGHKKPGLETRFILIFGLGAALLALESFIMNATNIGVSPDSVVLGGMVVSCLLLLVLLFRHHLRPGISTASSEGTALLLSSVAVLVLYGFAALHQPFAKESYTEFSVIPHSSPAVPGQMYEADLVTASHEKDEHIYTVLCKDAAGQERMLFKSVLEPESGFTITWSLPPPDSSEKVRLNLYRDESKRPYRWVELIASNCDLLR